MIKYTLAVLTLVLAGCTGAPQLSGDDTQNRVVDIVNTTNSPAQFYALNAERRRAFRARFAEAEVAANYYLTVNFVDGSGACLFDLRAVTAGGQTFAAPRFNTCAEVSWVISSKETP